MKKICLIIIIAMLLSSCNNDKDAIIASLEVENQQLKGQVSTELSSEDSLESYTTSDFDSETKKASDEEIKEYVNYLIYDYYKDKDDFKETTFIYHNITQANMKYTERKPLYLYMGLKDTSRITLHIVARYSGENWLFFNKAQIKTDDGVYTIFDNIASYDKTEDVLSYGKVIELYDLHPVSDTVIDLFNKLNPEKSYVVRLSGKDHYKEYEIESSEVKAFQETIACYEKIKDVLESRIIPQDYLKAKEEGIIETKAFHYLDRSEAAKYRSLSSDDLLVIAVSYYDENTYLCADWRYGGYTVHEMNIEIDGDTVTLTSKENEDFKVICYSDNSTTVIRDGEEFHYKKERVTTRSPYTYLNKNIH